MVKRVEVSGFTTQQVKEIILKCPADRYLDYLIDVYVFDKRTGFNSYYSVDIHSTEKVLKHLNKPVTIEMTPTDASAIYSVSIGGATKVYSDSLPHAICLAALIYLAEKG